MATLIIEKTGSQEQLGQTFPLIDSGVANRIGRDRSNQVPLLDQRASRVHCRLHLRLGHWQLEDNGSRNGTLYRGERVDRKVLRDDDTFQIGSTLLHVVADRTDDPASDGELQGCRPETFLGGSGGVLRYRALQLAMDRTVRLDAIHPSWRCLASGAEHAERLGADLERLTAAAQRISHASVAELLSANLPDRHGGGSILFRPLEVRPLQAAWSDFTARSFEDRLRFAFQLAGAVLARGREPGLRLPLGLDRLGVDAEGNPALPPADLAGYLAWRLGTVVHLPELIPYLPPEVIQAALKPNGATSGDGMDEAAQSYNLGALLYHLLSTRRPMGDAGPGAALKNHVRLAPAPLDALTGEAPPLLTKLLSSLLAKQPAERPCDEDAILDALAQALDAVSQRGGEAEGGRSARAGAASAGQTTAGSGKLGDASDEFEAFEPFDEEDAGASGGVEDEPSAVPVAAASRPRGDRPRAARSQPWWLWLPLWVAILGLIFVGARLGTFHLLRHLKLPG